MSSILRRAGTKLGRWLARDADPAVAVGVQTYAKDGGGVAHLFAMSDDGTVYQLTPNTAYRYREVAVSGAVAVDDEIIAVAGSGSPVSLTLPLAAACPAGQRFVVKDADGVAAQFAITVEAAGGDLVDGADGVTIALPYGSIDLVTDGVAAWRLV